MKKASGSHPAGSLLLWMFLLNPHDNSFCPTSPNSLSVYKVIIFLNSEDGLSFLVRLLTIIDRIITNIINPINSHMRNIAGLEKDVQISKNSDVDFTSVIIFIIIPEEYAIVPPTILLLSQRRNLLIVQRLTFIYKPFFVISIVYSLYSYTSPFSYH